VAWNNRAWVQLQQGDPAKLESALQSVERALELQPRAHRFRETRGQIWLRLGKWERALADLEYAQSGMPPTPSLEAALATAYAALGGPPPDAAGGNFRQKQ
jgi:regulator of sirC expression with transglutaminase-like and TPR domain